MSVLATGSLDADGFEPGAHARPPVVRAVELHPGLRHDGLLDSDAMTPIDSVSGLCRNQRLRAKLLHETEAISIRIEAAALRAVHLSADHLSGRRGEVVVSNGGKRILVLTSGAAAMAAPDELGCWTKAARALHQALSDAFLSPR